jgi:hypothetical protein
MLIPMSMDLEDRVRVAAPTLCRDHGMPLYPTIVGPRCPICGAAATH